MKTFDRLLTVFQSVFEGEISSEKIYGNASLVEDLGLNSIGMLYMAMAIEAEFGIKFSNQDFSEITTVNDVVAIIESKL